MGATGHRSLETRKKMRDIALTSRGFKTEDPAEMLDLFLQGESVADIAKAYKRGTGRVYNSIAKEALFRLMTKQAAERLEELDGIDGK